jgi:hypothetical protein
VLWGKGFIIGKPRPAGRHGCAYETPAMLSHHQRLHVP